MPGGIVPFTHVGIAALKRAIREQCPEVKSSHIDEAIAYGFGFDKYAAMLPVLKEADRNGYLCAEVQWSGLASRLPNFGHDPMALRGLIGVVYGLQTAPHPQAEKRGGGTQRMFKPKPANDG